MSKKSYPSAHKARKMLEENQANGQPLSARQKRYFGLIASGKAPRKK